MKKSIFTLVAIICAFSFSSLSAQKNAIAFGGDFGWANALGEFANSGSGGLNISGHIKYGLSDKLQVGGEYNASFLVALDDGSNNSLSVSLWGVSNYSAKVWYTFFDKKVSPYVSAGLGLSQVGEPDVNDIEGATRFGFDASGEVGLKLGYFYLAYRIHGGARSPKEPVFFTGIANLPVTTQNFAIGLRYSIDRD